MVKRIDCEEQRSPRMLAYGKEDLLAICWLYQVEYDDLYVIAVFLSGSRQKGILVYN
ncbi:MAG: hypothetical protein IPN94_19675 [Sphingobacteriales bacterium]|nr:hypothetical protein [Sphingobacteriales bacterium]